MKRGYFTVFAIKSQPKDLTAEKLKGNYSLKKKKQSVRVILECMLKEGVTTRSSSSQMLFKIGVLENFTIFTGKRQFWSIF